MIIEEVKKYLDMLKNYPNSYNKLNNYVNKHLKISIRQFIENYHDKQETIDSFTQLLKENNIENYEVISTNVMASFLKYNKINSKTLYQELYLPPISLEQNIIKKTKKAL